MHRLNQDWQGINIRNQFLLLLSLLIRTGPLIGRITIHLLLFLDAYGMGLHEQITRMHCEWATFETFD